MKLSIALFITMALACLACSTSDSCKETSIQIPVPLKQKAEKSAFPYCSVLAQSLAKDTLALGQLIRFAYKTEDDSAIDHGIIFTEIALELGDEFFYEYILRQPASLQLLTAKLLDASMEYRNPPPQVEKKLPKTYQLLLAKYQ